MMDPQDKRFRDRLRHDQALRRLPPGRFRLELHTFSEGDFPRTPFLSERQRELQGYTLERLSEVLGGEEGTLSDPLGMPHRVSLKEFSGADRLSLRILPRFVFEPSGGPAVTSDQ
jgi:hypothetical protein